MMMRGGKGDDTYYVDNVGDTVFESSNSGVDEVISSVSFSVGNQYIEKVTLTGSANINATGNSLDSTLTGNSGNNVLDGKAGIDAMAGSKGDDTYYVDNVGDTVIEAANSGFDQVFSSVGFGLAGQHVESLTLTGNANINATGNSLNNAFVRQFGQQYPGRQDRRGRDARR